MRGACMLRCVLRPCILCIICCINQPAAPVRQPEERVARRLLAHLCERTAQDSHSPSVQDMPPAAHRRHMRTQHTHARADRHDACVCSKADVRRV